MSASLKSLFCSLQAVNAAAATASMADSEGNSPYTLHRPGAFGSAPGRSPTGAGPGLGEGTIGGGGWEGKTESEASDSQRMVRECVWEEW